MKPLAADRSSRLAAAVVVAAAAFGCGDGGDDGLPEPVRQLRGLALVSPVLSGGDYLLAGRWEVTAGEFDPAAVDEEDRALPATWLDRQQARDWAAARGLRLPTREEWRHVASAAPSSSRLQTLAANTLDLDFREELPVGVFERGRTPEGCYDLAGNVWEWVEGEVTSPLGLPPRAIACGGSFASWAWLGHAGRDAVRLLEAGERADDLGFRVVGEAEAWLLERIQPLWTEGVWRDEIRAGFASWRPPLRAQLALRLRRAEADAGFCDAVEGLAP